MEISFDSLVVPFLHRMGKSRPFERRVVSKSNFTMKGLGFGSIHGQSDGADSAFDI